MAKTAVIGASPNSYRYAYSATVRLREHGHEVVPLGIKTGTIEGQQIIDLRTKPRLSNIDTVTLYLSPKNQVEWEDYIFSLAPRRIIFNPGTENPQLAQKARSQSIDTIEACTLVMLSVGNY